MSIQEFNAQFAQANEQNALMGALSRLSLLDLDAVTARVVRPQARPANPQSRRLGRIKQRKGGDSRKEHDSRPLKKRTGWQVAILVLTLLRDFARLLEELKRLLF